MSALPLDLHRPVQPEHWRRDPVMQEALSLASRAGKAEARVDRLQAIIGLFLQAMDEEGSHARETMLRHAVARAMQEKAA